MFDFVVNILPCPFGCNNISTISCNSWLESTDFVDPLCLSPPCQRLYLSAVVSQYIRTDIELTSSTSPSLDHGTLFGIWLSTLVRDFLWCFPHNNRPSHASVPKVFSNILLQLRCMKLLHSGMWHFSKPSSALRNFAHSLHVEPILALTEKNGFEQNWLRRIKNDYPRSVPFSKEYFWISQWDFLKKILQMREKNSIRA